jgi:hypothetical protein
MHLSASSDAQIGKFAVAGEYGGGVVDFIPPVFRFSVSSNDSMTVI